MTFPSWYLLGNALKSADFDWKLELSRFPRPVDRTLWGMFPQTNNAYYDPTKNQTPNVTSVMLSSKSRVVNWSRSIPPS